MLSQRLANIVFAVIVFIACAWFAVMAQQFAAAGLLASSGLPSKFFPQLTLGFTAVCAVIVVASYLLRGSMGGDDGQQVFGEAADAWRGLLVLAVAVVSYFIWTNVGFIAMACLMGPACLIVMGVRSPVLYITVLGLTGLVYIVFTWLLRVQLV